MQRPPSSSLSGYGLGNDDARSPSSGGGTPGLMPPGSHLSGDNCSEAGKTPFFVTFSHILSSHFCLTTYIRVLWKKGETFEIIQDVSG